MSIGEALADAQRQSGLSVTQVSQRTRIRESIIRAIERGDFSSCGGDFYARGHIRSIARAVGIDPAPLIREYDEEHPPAAISAAEVFEPSTPIKIREPRRSFGLGRILVLVVLAAVGYGIYHVVSTHDSASGKPTSAPTVRPLVTTKPTPAVTHSAQPTPHKSTPPSKPDAVIVLTANEACWVGMTNSSGQQVYQGTIAAGQSMTWHEANLVSLVIGNPPGIQLTVNGKNVTPNTGQVATLTINPKSKTPVSSATGTSGTTATTGTSGTTG